MTEKELKIYLEAFWKGESSLEQEAALKAFFRGKDIPQALKGDQPYFEYLNKEQKKELENPDFDAQFFTQIQKEKVRRLWFSVGKIAAGLAFVAIAGWWYHNQHLGIPQKLPTSTQTDMVGLKDFAKSIHKKDSQRSYNLTKDALLLISKGINQDSSHYQELEKFKKQIDSFPQPESTEILP